MFIDANRDGTLLDKMKLAHELGATFIFVSVIDLAIISEGSFYIIECEDGLKDESTKRMSFTFYDDLIEYINDFYDYNKIEQEYSNMEGRIYLQRSDYEKYLKAKTVEPLKPHATLTLADFDDLVEHVYRLDDYCDLNSYTETIQQVLPLGITANNTLYNFGRDGD